MIDMHTHIVPADFPAYPGRQKNHGWPCMHCGEGHHRTVMIGDKPFREVSSNAWDTSRRLEEMAAEGVDRQVLSPMPELLSYWFSLDDALAFGRYINGTIAEMVAAAPQHFYGLGMVPLQDPERAAREVRSLKHEYGLVGVEVGSNINGIAISDRRFDPFFAALQEEDMCLFVHALHPTKERLYGPPLIEALVGFPNETGLCIAGFIANGVLDRFPRLRIAFSHGGGSFPMILPRLQHGWETSKPLREAILRSPQEVARQFWYDTLVYSEPALAYLMQIYGKSQLMIGTDYPFVIRESHPARRLQGLGLSVADHEALQVGNCLRFLGQ
ncbi:amidohydrolase [Pseudomonas sp. TH41]|nr:amidohydrolase [Pseudomonas sp. TH41]